MDELSPYTLDRLADLVAERVAARLRATVDPDAMLTGSEVAELLSVSRATIERWTADGTIPSHRIGRTRRYRRSEVLGVPPRDVSL